MNILSVVELKPNPNIPDISPGDTVKVSAKIVEGERERIQIFQGVVIGLRRGGAGANFTVRHVFHGIGVERTFPFYSPLVEKVEVVRHGKVRRAKLYYLRGRSGKASRIKEKRVDKKKQGDEGIKIAIEQIQEVKEMKGISGVHVMAIEWEERVEEIVTGAGLLPRPEV